MTTQRVLQGRSISHEDLVLIRELMAGHPGWNRTRLSRELCQRWGWRDELGRQKDMACRSLLLKLERRGEIELPRRHRPPVNHFRFKRVREVVHDRMAIEASLAELTPLRTEPVQDPEAEALWITLLHRYHYRDYSGSVGQNLKYLIRDRHERPVACLLFGSAAWKVLPRDEWIGWPVATRKKNLQFVTNNMRFLILPWVKVKHLASHILGGIAARIRQDWVSRYAHPIYLLETFVERDRFEGTCYRAANWIRVGSTRGRSRNDRYRTLRVPVKDIYLYPLDRRAREFLRKDGTT